MDRLSVQFPTLARQLDGLDDARRVALVEQLVHLAVEMNGIGRVVSESSDVGILAERLDADAFDVDEAFDRDAETQSRYQEAFRKARAATALATFRSDRSLAGCRDALYESIHSLIDGEGIAADKLARALESGI